MKLSDEDDVSETAGGVATSDDVSQADTNEEPPAGSTPSSTVAPTPSTATASVTTSTSTITGNVATSSTATIGMGTNTTPEEVDPNKPQWPSMVDLNHRLRRVINSYQRNFKKEEMKLANKAKVLKF